MLDHICIRWWDTFMVVLVAYSAWVYPFEVAFMNASPKGGLEVADIVVDLFFAVRDRKKITLRYTVHTQQYNTMSLPSCSIILSAMTGQKVGRNHTCGYDEPFTITFFQYNTPAA